VRAAYRTSAAVTADWPEGLALSDGSRGRVISASASAAVSCKPPSDAELLQRHVEQAAGPLDPEAVAGRFGQRQEAVGDAAVVLQHPDVRARGAVARDAEQPYAVAAGRGGRAPARGGRAPARGG
jgi:hypothetical protein